MDWRLDDVLKAGNSSIWNMDGYSAKSLSYSWYSLSVYLDVLNFEYGADKDVRGGGVVTGVRLRPVSRAIVEVAAKYGFTSGALSNYQEHVKFESKYWDSWKEVGKSIRKYY